MFCSYFDPSSCSENRDAAVRGTRGRPMLFLDDISRG